MSDEGRDDRSVDRALLIAVPLRHLESFVAAGDEATLLPAGGPGDLAATPLGTAVYVMAIDVGDAEVPAATWRATYAGRPAYEPGAPWPPGLPPTWVAEHQPPTDADDGAPTPDRAGGDADEWSADDWSDWADDEDQLGPQAFLAVTGLQPLPRQAWVFTNELVPKQARRGRSFRPRVPTLVNLPD